MGPEEAAAVVAITSVVSLAVEELLSSSDEESDVLEKTDMFFEITVPYFNDMQFKQHFRVTPDTFDWLLGQLQRYEEPILSAGRPKIALAKRIMCFLWYLANREAFRSVADRFGLAKQTSWVIFYEICQKLLRLNTETHIIHFPTGNAAFHVMSEFERINGFPGIVGAIDGCHIRIEKPQVHGNSCINRKGYPSVLLQGICNSKKMFIDVYAGEPGSIHDQRLFYKSDIYNKIRNGIIEIPENGFLIGDLAYKVTTTLMVGFKNNGHLTHRQIRFNQSLNQNRVVIENTFGLLKSRFRRLKHLETRRMDFIPLIIVAGCLMHNICQGRGDFYHGRIDYETEDDIEDGDDEDDTEAQEKRENLINFVLRNE